MPLLPVPFTDVPGLVPAPPGLVLVPGPVPAPPELGPVLAPPVPVPPEPGTTPGTTPPEESRVQNGYNLLNSGNKYFT